MIVEKVFSVLVWNPSGQQTFFVFITYLALLIL